MPRRTDYYDDTYNQRVYNKLEAATQAACEMAQAIRDKDKQLPKKPQSNNYV